MLVKYRRNLFARSPLEEPLRILLEKIAKADSYSKKTKRQPAVALNCVKPPPSKQRNSSGFAMIIGRILQFCCGDKSKSFVLPQPPSFTCKLPLDPSEKQLIAKELFSPHLKTID
eukprot:TRINITY_DN3395_c0_g6_i3.p1 TRINITY_DN3395_c0_g6~~TRINITY_DN3395_c0_g6_i3.p1  ORF type:complete len:115 (+),score=14.36 TRINITY_DN3395_c0_g6_i3:47-391(+)